MARAASLAPHKDRAVRQMRRTAALLDADHPETIAGDHLRDAARTLEHGQLDGAKRHLDAAMEVLTPRNLIRHGITDDEGHATAKHHMHQVHRHRLAVQDIEDAQGRNDRLRAMARAARGQPEPLEPFHRPPPEPAVAAANRHAKVIQLAGPHGYTHGWVYHGAQGSQGHYAAVLGHASLDRIDRQSHASITSHITLAKSAAASGDHTTAEIHLTDARRKATRLGEPDLAQAIGTLKNYHHRQAAEAIGVKPNITQGQMNRVVAREQARPRPKPRIVPPRGYQPPFALSNIDLAGPKGYVHGWIKVEDASPFSGRVVHGKAAGGGTVNGVYDHATKTIRPRHTKPIPVTHVMKASEPVPEVRARGRIARYRQALAYGMATELSARTALLERTPAPRGKPGGPGLYDVSGMGHTPYLQQVVKALIEKRGMPEGKAYAIARAAIRKWGVRSKHPEVKSAAIRAESGELARQARAKASHSHANEWDVADTLIELACDSPEVIDLFNPYHAPTGQFTTSSGAGAGQGKGSKAQQRQKLRKQITSLRSRIRSLEAQLPSRHGHSTRRSKSGTPRKKGAGAQSARQAKAGKTGKAASSHARTRSPSAIRAQIAILRGQLKLDIAQLRRLK